MNFLQCGHFGSKNETITGPDMSSASASVNAVEITDLKLSCVRITVGEKSAEMNSVVSSEKSLPLTVLIPSPICAAFASAAGTIHAALPTAIAMSAISAGCTRRTAIRMIRITRRARSFPRSPPSPRSHTHPLRPRACTFDADFPNQSQFGTRNRKHVCVMASASASQPRLLA